MVSQNVPRALASEIAPVLRSIASVVVGKAEAVEQTLVAVLAGGHLLVEDVPGVGKTTLARALARSIGGSFSRDPVHARPAAQRRHRRRTCSISARAASSSSQGPIFANVVLADELNRATPRTQAALLEAMEERQVTLEGTTRPLPNPFLVIATQNPIELEGTFPLPEAQLDRFLLRLRIGYPSERDEQELVERFARAAPLDEVHPVMDLQRLDGADPRRPRHPRRAVDPQLRRRAGPGHPRAQRRPARRQPARHAGAVPRRPGAGRHQGADLRRAGRRQGAGGAGPRPPPAADQPGAAARALRADRPGRGRRRRPPCRSSDPASRRLGRRHPLAGHGARHRCSAWCCSPSPSGTSRRRSRRWPR